MPEQLTRIEQKLDQVIADNQKLKTYLFWSVAIPIALLVLPLLAIPFMLPFLNSYISSLSLPAGF